MNPYSAIFQALNDADISYLVVGGVAVNLHGYSRYTGDLDIVMTLDTENLARMDKLMQEKGYVQRLPVDVKLLANEEQVKKWLTEKGMTAYTFIDSALPQNSIDIIVDDSLKFTEFDKNKVVISAWGIKIPVISVNDLIGMKKAANRQKDAEDISALLELKGL